MIHHGDLFDVLPLFAPDSIDACVTDPPYEIGFMGQAWDRTGVAVSVDTWREVIRVMKPGGYLLAFGAPRSYHRMAVAIEDAGFNVRDSIAWLYGSGFPKSKNLGDGKGTALKPAFEPIVVAWKPFAGTISNCHAAHGTAALHIDACRIGFSKNEPYDITEKCRPNARTSTYSESAIGPSGGQVNVHDSGRWPANVVMDESAALMLDAQSGELTSGDRKAGTHARLGYQGWCRGPMPELIGDSGGASRFFYVAKPSRDERDRGLESRGNHHPTVKPVELMRWLVRLVTPVGGVILDPFMGSGTTGMACVYEQRHFVGVEREAAYVTIAERRIASVAPLFTESA